LVRVANSVLRRPAWYAAGAALVLLALATPSARASLGGLDERALPAGASSRVVAERLASDFTASPAPVLVLITGGGPTAGARFVREVSTVGKASGATVIGSHNGSTLVGIAYPASSTSDQTGQLVRAVRGLPAPPGAQVVVTGQAATGLDAVTSVNDRLPWVGLYVAVVGFGVFLIAFGSVVLAALALLLTALSVGAAVGVVVWAFQDGHLSGLLGNPATGHLEPTSLLVLLIILYGLSTDHAVWLFARAGEAWEHTGDPVAAASAGLRRTGGLIAAAAILMVTVVAGFVIGATSTITLLGAGTAVALAVDAVLVRTVLTPAAMRLLGRRTWWAPAGLTRLSRRSGRREKAAAQRPPQPAGVRYPAADGGRLDTPATDAGLDPRRRGPGADAGPVLPPRGVPVARRGPASTRDTRPGPRRG
jgi:RND superfamily putative drug exporter